jgi:hypothetical protein
MASRGLPGFLRRSRRRDDYDDDDDDDDDDDEEEDKRNSNDNDDGVDIVRNEKYYSNGGNKTASSTTTTIAAAAAAAPAELDISLQFLDPSPLAESSAQEDMEYTGATTAVTTTNNNNQDDEIAAAIAAASLNGQSEVGDEEQYHYNNDNMSLSTLGDNDPYIEASALNNNRSMPPSRTLSNMSNTSGGPRNTKKTTATYREIQFEKVLSTPVVKLSELRKIGWNGIPVSSGL